MAKSHAAGLGSDAPTPAQLKELHAQIESGRVTKDSLQAFLRGGQQELPVILFARQPAEELSPVVVGYWEGLIPGAGPSITEALLGVSSENFVLSESNGTEMVEDAIFWPEKFSGVRFVMPNELHGELAAGRLTLRSFRPTLEKFLLDALEDARNHICYSGNLWRTMEYGLSNAGSVYGWHDDRLEEWLWRGLELSVGKDLAWEIEQAIGDKISDNLWASAMAAVAAQFLGSRIEDGSIVLLRLWIDGNVLLGTDQTDGDLVVLCMSK